MNQVIWLVRWEWFRLSRRVGALALLISALLPALPTVGIAAWLNSSASPFSESVSYFQAAAGLLFWVSPLLAVFLAALVHATDLQGGNCRTLTAWGAARDTVLSAKLLLCSLLLLVYHLIIMGIAVLAAVAVFPHFQDWGNGVIGAGVSLLASFLYLALGTALAYWRQSTVFTVGLGLSLIFFEAVAYPIAGGLGQLFDWPVNRFTDWTLWGIAQGLQGESLLLARGWFIPIAAGYIGLLLGLARLAFRRSDLRAGGD